MSERISTKEEAEQHDQDSSQNVRNLIHAPPEGASFHQPLQLLATLVKISLNFGDSCFSPDKELSFLKTNDSIHSSLNDSVISQLANVIQLLVIKVKFIVFIDITFTLEGR